MDKDEMKNRISLALKDPILQQGFEIICKENATLKEDYECLEDAHNVLNELYEKLEKENADLKAKVGLSIDCEKAQKNGELCLGYGGDEDEPCERCKNCIKCECGYYNLGETEKDEQLTKAKEIIKKFSEFVNNDIEYDLEHPQEHTDLWNELCEQAEQFIKECK